MIVLDEIIPQIVADCVRLKNKYIEEKDLAVDWVCIFSHSQDEYEELLKQARVIGELTETTPSGLIFKFIKSPQTVAGKPKIFKIRQPDITKPELGDSDFTTDYEQFKSKYLDNKKFNLIKREKFEMIELMDSKFNVRVYFSSIPPSKLRGLN
jgi:hypothetical protein